MVLKQTTPETLVLQEEGLLNVYGATINSTNVNISSLTQGSVLFAGAAGLISQDNAQLSLMTQITRLVLVLRDLEPSLVPMPSLLLKVPEQPAQHLL